MISEEKIQALADQLGQSLKQWHQATENTTLYNFLPYLTKQEVTVSQDSSASHINQLLHDLLEALEDTDEVAANLLHRLYIENEKGFIVAKSLNISESSLYRQRRAALLALARTAAIEEGRAQSDRRARLEARLELPVELPLVGITGYLERLRKAVTPASDIRLVCLSGIGGIGKTSLAVTLVREIIENGSFNEIAWVSARTQEFTTWGTLEQADETHLDEAELITLLHKQLNDGEDIFLPATEILLDIKARLSRTSHLIVIDNLETANDYRQLLPLLTELSQDACILLTSRIGVFDYPEIHTIPVQELLRYDAETLIREEARRRGIVELYDAGAKVIDDIYETAGGNPLALKLLIGQIQVRSLSIVLADLVEARGQRVEALYEFIYRNAWNALDEPARHVLLTMPLIAKPGTSLEHLTGVTGLAQDALYDALDFLIRLSLIDVGGTLDMRRYRIHRLTETFLHKQVTKWSPL